MRAHLLTTLREALRTPSVWVLTLLGTLSVVVGLSLSVLALGDLAATGNPLLRESARTTAALVGLWVLCLGHESDRVSGFTPALDATAPGPAGRSIGRLLGALLAAVPGALPATVVGAALLGAEAESPIWLLFTTISPVLLILAWGRLLLRLTASAPTTLLAALLLWSAGHLPWGRSGWGGPFWGRAVGAVLPGGRPIPELLAAAGLLALAAFPRAGAAARA